MALPLSANTGRGSPGGEDAVADGTGYRIVWDSLIVVYRFPSQHLHTPSTVTRSARQASKQLARSRKPAASSSSPSCPSQLIALRGSSGGSLTVATTRVGAWAEELQGGKHSTRWWCLAHARNTLFASTLRLGAQYPHSFLRRTTQTRNNYTSIFSAFTHLS